MPIGSFKSRRCNDCNTQWPNNKNFHRCPVCGVSTWASSQTPISNDEAHKRRLYAEFERYYQAREKERDRADLEGMPIVEPDRHIRA